MSPEADADADSTGGRALQLRVAGMLLSIALVSAVPAQSLDPLVHQGVIEAPIETVWTAWTTGEGLRSWLAPHAEIDLKIGGAMRTNYDPAGDLDDPQTIENTILAFEPMRMLAFKVSQAPADFPFADTIGDMWTVVYFEASGPERTNVRVAAMGFTASPESQAMRAFFEQGNATTIEQMQRSLGSAAR